MKLIYGAVSAVLVLFLVLFGLSCEKSWECGHAVRSEEPNLTASVADIRTECSAEEELRERDKEVSVENRKVIYLAGGCFWGVEGYFKRLDGVLETTTGYANGHSDEANYQDLAVTDHAETVKVEYDYSVISAEELLLHYFRIIDPTSVNRQGADVGRQYRTGIYYVNEADRAVIEKIMDVQRRKYGRIAVECEALTHFVPAEDYHQDYLDKNPRGYCHVDLGLAERPLFERFAEAKVPGSEELKKMLTAEEFEIMVNSGTERPHSSSLNAEYRKGIYVDKVTKVPLFASQTKFDAGCGWPSFSKPILTGSLEEIQDHSHGMIRTEVRSGSSGLHLGHVFTDGPKEMGGLRYCINGASIEFIPYGEMKERGYEEYMPLCE